LLSSNVNHSKRFLNVIPDSNRKPVQKAHDVFKAQKNVEEQNCKGVSMVEGDTWYTYKCIPNLNAK
jgi:hypothetical protein